MVYWNIIHSFTFHLTILISLHIYLMSKPCKQIIYFPS